MILLSDDNVAVWRLFYGGGAIGDGDCLVAVVYGGGAIGAGGYSEYCL